MTRHKYYIKELIDNVEYLLRIVETDEKPSEDVMEDIKKTLQEAVKLYPTPKEVDEEKQQEVLDKTCNICDNISNNNEKETDFYD